MWFFGQSQDSTALPLNSYQLVQYATLVRERRWKRSVISTLCVGGLILALVSLAVVERRSGQVSPFVEGLTLRLWRSTYGIWFSNDSADAPFWRMCPSDGNCDKHSWQHWKLSPRLLAQSVDEELNSLPGVDDEGYASIAQHWRDSPPLFYTVSVELRDIARFMRQLLESDPFGTGDQVPYIDFRDASGGSKTVAVTQRQLAFLVANALMGNTIDAGDGLSAALKRCSSRRPAPQGYLYSLLSLLAVLSQELSAPGAQGTVLVSATPGSSDASWKNKLSDNVLEVPIVCGNAANKSACGSHADFMMGGTPFQALTDIAGTVVGGGAELCEVADSQDESLVQFYSEVLAFSFFAGPGPAGPNVPGDSHMLPVPWALLGTRRYLGEISGESSAKAPFFNSCGKIRQQNWLNSDIGNSQIARVRVDDQHVTLVGNAFIAVASKSSAASNDCPNLEAMNNNCPNQRSHLDEDVALWYQAFEPSGYGVAAQDAFKGIVQQIGTGPWGAGVWYGDSQQYFLAVWLATSLLGSATLNYYVYDHFCENPGNQCFLLGHEDCVACIRRSNVDGDPIQASRCGSRDFHSIIQQFQGRSALQLYKALSSIGSPPTQVFDLLSSYDAGPPMSTPARVKVAVRPLDNPSWKDHASSLTAAQTTSSPPAEVFAPVFGTPSAPSALADGSPSAEHFLPGWQTQSAVPTHTAGEVMNAKANSHSTTLANMDPRSEQEVAYSLVGFASRTDAPSFCGQMRMAMPKTAGEHLALKHAVQSAISDGTMTHEWPTNTIWLGGHWSTVSQQWYWDDGTSIFQLTWAQGQPSAASNQATEPFLVLTSLGYEVHDAGLGTPPYKFGVMCEKYVRVRVLDAVEDAKGLESADRAAITTTATTPMPTRSHSVPSTDTAISVGPPRYVFKGFGTFRDASSKCKGMRLASPRTAEEIKLLQTAVDAVTRKGLMTSQWPQNTVWLGCQWNGIRSRWETSSGEAMTGMKWSMNQPSSAKHQHNEPYLVMYTNGEVDDANLGVPHFSYGIFCEHFTSVPQSGFLMQ